MPKRKKRRTHVEPEAPLSGPFSFVMRRGRVGTAVKELVRNLRTVLSPHTATNLKERRKNVMKDFLAVSAQLGVTHMITLSQATMGLNLRVMRVPHGPTLTFRVVDYSLCRDVTNRMKRPHPLGPEAKLAPLLVMNAFSGEQLERKVMAAMFQNLFPPLDVDSMRLADCRRVVLLNLNPTTNTVDFRHYVITASPVGLTKTVKKIIKAKLPDLGKYEDISQYVLNEHAALSDSEVEDTPDNRLTLAQSIHGRGNRERQKVAIRLREVGPRLTLRLLKVQEGLLEGRVLYHAFEKRTREEAEKQERERQRIKQEKAARRAEQERNVQRKEAEREQRKREQTERQSARQQSQMRSLLDDEERKHLESVGVKREELEDAGEEEESDSPPGIHDAEFDDKGDRRDFGMDALSSEEEQDEEEQEEQEEEANAGSDGDDQGAQEEDVSDVDDAPQIVGEQEDQGVDRTRRGTKPMRVRIKKEKVEEDGELGGRPPSSVKPKVAVKEEAPASDEDAEPAGFHESYGDEVNLTEARAFLSRVGARAAREPTAAPDLVAAAEEVAGKKKHRYTGKRGRK